MPQRRRFERVWVKVFSMSEKSKDQTYEIHRELGDAGDASAVSQKTVRRVG
jgi:hypothetical protein